MELGPRDVDRSIRADGHGFVIGELPIRALGDSLAVESAHQAQRIGHAPGLPGCATISRPAEKECGAPTVIVEAREVGGAIGTERRGGISTKVSVAGSRHGGIVCEARNSGKEPARQRRGPRLSAVERRVHAAAVVVVPVIVSCDEVPRIQRIDRERRLVLRSGVVGHVDDSRDGQTSGC